MSEKVEQSASAHVASTSGSASEPQTFNPFTALKKTEAVTKPETATTDKEKQVNTTESSTVAVADSTTESAPEAEVVVEGAESTAEYEPVVKLELVETKTGEENEEELYKQRAALYRFDSAANEWKERGKGDVKFLKHLESGKIRILLRQDKTLKCCLNHVVYSDLQLRPNAGSDRSWTWRCRDYSGDEPEDQTFAIRFKDAEIAKVFKDKFDKVKQENANNEK